MNNHITDVSCDWPTIKRHAMRSFTLPSLLLLTLIILLHISKSKIWMESHPTGNCQKVPSLIRNISFAWYGSEFSKNDLHILDYCKWMTWQTSKSCIHNSKVSQQCPRQWISTPVKFSTNRKLSVSNANQKLRCF